MAKEWKELAETLYQEGLKDTEIAKRCGVCSRSVRLWRMSKGYRTVIKKNPDDNPNPCFLCQRNISECPWLHENKPVPGWDAVLIVKSTCIKRKRYEYMTWAIKECPLYIPPQEGRALE